MPPGFESDDRTGEEWLGINDVLEDVEKENRIESLLRG
jgi:hypothetical protein